VLANSRQGNLAAGGFYSTNKIKFNNPFPVLGSLVFCFSLTAISNMKMAQFGSATKSGLLDCFGALLIAIIASAAIHRIAITLCVLFSAIFLFFFVGISHKRYDIHHAVGGGGIGTEKRKK
jgi:uncharacterized membrane protein